MKLVVLGANGGTGKHVLRAALEDGMTVTAVVRSEGKRPEIDHPNLKIVVGDPCDPAFLKTVLRGQDALISTLGGRAPTKVATSVYYRSADAIVEAAWDTGLKRVLVTSTALLFPEQTLLGTLLQYLVPNVVRSADKMEKVLQSSGLNWTAARAGFLNDVREATYRAVKGALPKDGTAVPRLALARFLVDAVQNPETNCAAYGVSHAAA
ncbi:NAD(P)-dependent oxidoreductase [Roseobacter sp. S98]|uniref:NAD(P)-dependent oxidoreductase n=1 Tax=Roseobacter algicola (ex Choi et al. 2025) (nom. illeg.) TaxID=3092138 RepID=UPI003F51272B